MKFSTLRHVRNLMWLGGQIFLIDSDVLIEVLLIFPQILIFHMNLLLTKLKVPNPSNLTTREKVLIRLLF